MVTQLVTTNQLFEQVPEWDSERATAFTCLRHFSRLIEMSRPDYERRSAGSKTSSSMTAAVGPPPLGAKDCVSPTAVRDKETGIEYRRELTRRNSERDRDRNSIGHSREYSTREREFPKYDNKSEVRLREVCE